MITALQRYGVTIEQIRGQQQMHKMSHTEAEYRVFNNAIHYIRLAKLSRTMKTENLMSNTS